MSPLRIFIIQSVIYTKGHVKWPRSARGQFRNCDDRQITNKQSKCTTAYRILHSHKEASGCRCQRHTRYFTVPSFLDCCDPLTGCWLLTDCWLQNFILVSLWLSVALLTSWLTYLLWLTFDVTRDYIGHSVNNWLNCDIGRSAGWIVMSRQ